MKKILVMGLCTVVAAGASFADAGQTVKVDQKLTPINLGLSTGKIAPGVVTNESVVLESANTTSGQADDLLKTYTRLKENDMSIPTWMTRALFPNAGTTSHGSRVGGADASTATPIMDTSFGAVYSDMGTTLAMGDSLNTPVIGTECATFGSLASEDSWYSFTLGAQTLVNASLCSAVTTYDSKIAIVNAALDLVAYNDDSCGLQSEAECCLPAGDYYIVVDGFGSATGDYELTATFADCGILPCDLITTTTIAALPAVEFGTTIGAPDIDSDGGGNALYEFVADTNCDLTISTCNAGSDYDTYLRLYDTLGPCDGGVEIAGNDDSCGDFSGLLSTITYTVTAGTTYIVNVEGFSSSEGNFELSIACAIPCTPPVCDGLPTEGEALYTGDDITNGGCNSPDQLAFGSVLCGDEWCGDFFTFIGDTTMSDTTLIGANLRDTDWYEISTVGMGTQTLEVSVESCADFSVIITEADCAGATLASASGLESTAVATTACLAEGTYWVIIVPNVFTGMDVPETYRASVTCTPCSLPCEAFVCNDIDAIAGFNGINTNVGAPDIQGSTAGDVGYCFTMPYDFNLDVETCFAGTDFDTDSDVYSGDPCNGGTLVSHVDGDSGCEFTAWSTNQHLTCLPAGDYTVVITGYIANEGNFEVDITTSACVPCEVDCTGLPSEGEALYTGDDLTNGGCNSPTMALGSIVCGDEWCGDFFTFVGDTTMSDTTLIGANLRDTDWYELVTFEDDIIEVTVESCGDFVVIITEGACDGAQLAAVSGIETTLTATTSCVPAGSYYVIILPNVFSGMDVPESYRASVTCTPCVVPTCDNDTWDTAAVINLGDTVISSTTPCNADWVADLDQANLLCPWTGYFSATSTAHGPDQYFSLSLAAATEVNFDMCNSSYDTSMLLFNDLGVAPLPTDMVLGNDDSCGLQSNMTCVLPAGDYLLQVSGWSTSAGDFELTVSAIVPPCDPVTDLMIAQGAMPNTLDLSWTAVAGATGYNLLEAADGDFGSAVVIPLGMVTTATVPSVLGNTHYRVVSVCP